MLWGRTGEEGEHRGAFKSNNHPWGIPALLVHTIPCLYIAPSYWASQCSVLFTHPLISNKERWTVAKARKQEGGEIQMETESVWVEDGHTLMERGWQHEVQTGSGCRTQDHVRVMFSIIFMIKSLSQNWMKPPIAGSTTNFTAQWLCYVYQDRFRIEINPIKWKVYQLYVIYTHHTSKSNFYLVTWGQCWILSAGRHWHLDILVKLHIIPLLQKVIKLTMNQSKTKQNKNCPLSIQSHDVFVHTMNILPFIYIQPLQTSLLI